MKFTKLFITLFRVDDTLESYKPSVIKMIISAVLIPITLLIRLNVYIENEILEKFAASFSALFIVLCAQCFIMAWSELGHVHDNKEKRNASFQEYNKIAIDISLKKLLSMIKKEDIICFDILFNEKIIHVGASSDSTPSKFFDKRYYINDVEFEDFEEFKIKLSEYLVNNCIKVASIDDVPVKKYLKGTQWDGSSVTQGDGSSVCE